ncbi:hypothetical protein Ciccas_008612 [Cichlidogyrus casuarinus]|uniref:Uncharacterized protein n=1 Tax=Cichlidogyrus casuarinus TaxID=1844966 RepID=A0ABD2PZZ1_9PLAT
MENAELPQSEMHLRLLRESIIARSNSSSTYRYFSELESLANREHQDSVNLGDFLEILSRVVLYKPTGRVSTPDLKEQISQKLTEKLSNDGYQCKLNALEETLLDRIDPEDIHLQSYVTISVLIKYGELIDPRLRDLKQLYLEEQRKKEEEPTLRVHCVSLLYSPGIVQIGVSLSSVRSELPNALNELRHAASLLAQKAPLLAINPDDVGANLQYLSDDNSSAERDSKLNLFYSQVRLNHQRIAVIS